MDGAGLSAPRRAMPTPGAHRLGDPHGRMRQRLNEVLRPRVAQRCVQSPTRLFYGAYTFCLPAAHRAAIARAESLYRFLVLLCVQNATLSQSSEESNLTHT
jgi:hypothetical protein